MVKETIAERVMIMAGIVALVLCAAEFVLMGFDAPITVGMKLLGAIGAAFMVFVGALAYAIMEEFRKERGR